MVASSMLGSLGSRLLTLVGIVLGCVTIAAMGCILPTRAQVVDTHSVTRVEGAKRSRVGKRADEDRSEGPTALVLEEASAADEGSFCRATRPVLRELRGSVGRHVRCTAGRYVEGGYFGTTRDIVTSSFHNACFHGSTTHGEGVMYHEQPIPEVASRITTTLRISADLRLDLSSYGVVPGTYVLENPRGVTSAKVEISFHDAVVRAPTNLGYAILQLVGDREAPEHARSSASSCLAHLCTEGSVYTSDIVSASPRIHVDLRGGRATSLRPLEVNSAASITGDGQQFVIRPALRVNLAARFRPSRIDMGNACLAGADVEPEPPGWTPPCSTIIHHGIHVTLDGCQRSSRTVVTCRFSVLSRGRDRELWIHVDGGSNEVSTLVDGEGSSRSARMGNAGSEWEDGGLRVPLVADVPTPASLEFRDIASTSTHASRVMLRARTDRELRFEFRGIEFEDELGRCRAGGLP